nr:ribonuclease H-like domain-containing protein [Tanacetum cinerariifolium]
MSDHEDDTITEENAPPKVVPQITTVTNISAKFLYLKKGEYDIWAMKMQNFISSSDLLCWNIVLKGNSAKSMTIDNDGNLKIRHSVSAEEHLQVQREEKARTILLSALPDEHIGDFYHMIDARDIWNAIKARFEEGLDKCYDKMQKILTQMNTLKIKPEPEDVNMKFLRGLPPSWTGIALILKTKGGLEYISFDDLYNKLKFLEIDTKGYSSSSSTLSNVAFVHRFEKKHGRKIKFNDRENARFDKKLVKCFNCKQMGHFSRECRAQGGQNSINYQKYKSKEAGKDGSDSKAMVVVDGSIDWDKQTEEGNTEPRSLENFDMVAGIEIESDADSEGEVVSADDAIPAGVSVSAGDVAAAVSPQSETEFALMGLSTEDNSLRLDMAKDRDSFLPTIFWTEAVATACYVLNRELVTKPHDKTPYELLTGDKPSISYLRPFGYVLIIQSTPTPVVPIVDEATTQNDGTKSDHAKTNADNLDELAELQALQRQEQAGKEEADRLGLVFPSLNPILGVGTASIGSSISAGSTPHVSAGSTPPMSLCASPISADRHSISAGKSHVFAGRPTGSAGRPVSAGRLSGSADRTPVSAGRILGKFTASASSERFSRASNVENLDIHDGLKIFDCSKSG